MSKVIVRVLASRFVTGIPEVPSAVPLRRGGRTTTTISCPSHIILIFVFARVGHIKKNIGSARISRWLGQKIVVVGLLPLL